MTKRSGYAAVLPIGPCRECLQQFLRGGGPNEIEVAGEHGGVLVALHCRHNAAGAFSWLDIPGRAVRWTIESPIELEEFVRMVKSLPGIRQAVQAAQMDGPAASETVN